jgi:predicted esterase
LDRLARRLAPLLIKDSEEHGEEMQESFRRQRPIAVVEDICSFYMWLEERHAEFQLSGTHILAGSSAGGISVLNSLMLSEAIGKKLPKIRSAFVFSGGFAYPSYWKDSDTRILALHNPQDPQVPFSSIKRIEGIAQKHFTLLISDQYAHGSFALTPNENYLAAIDRLIVFDRAAAQL